MASDTDGSHSPLLGPDEPPAVELVNAEGGSRVVLVCDHASNRIPQRLGNLGLDPAQLASHIAWDPGAAEVARSLSVQLDAPLLLSGYSRLVIDCNRPLHSAESIASHSAGIQIAGNHGLSPAQRQHRIDALFRPYHDAIDRLLAERAQRRALLLSIHSFTPVWHGQPRPWHIGISGWHETRFTALLIDALAGEEAISVGDNQPYPIEDDIDYTLPLHADAHGIPGVMIEIRQDVIDTEAAAIAWARRLAQAYRIIEASVLKNEFE